MTATGPFTRIILNVSIKMGTDSDLMTYLMSNFKNNKYADISLVELYASDNKYFMTLIKKHLINKEAILFFSKEGEKVKSAGRIPQYEIRRFQYNLIIQEYLKDQKVSETKDQHVTANSSKKLEVLEKQNNKAQKDKDDFVALYSTIIEEPFHCAIDLSELIKIDTVKATSKRTGNKKIIPRFECPKCKRKYTSISGYSDFHKITLLNETYTNITREQDNIRYTKLSSNKQESDTQGGWIPSSIDIEDFIVKRTVFKCTHSEHKLQDIDATIEVIDRYGEIKEATINAGYCPNCDVFFIMESTFQRLKYKGIPLCRVSEEKAYLSANSFNNDLNLAPESILMQYGYNVSQAEGLTATRRRAILALLIDKDICTRNQIISYLDSFVSLRRTQSRYALAIKKWESDCEFVSEYKLGSYTRYGVGVINRKDYSVF